MDIFSSLMLRVSSLGGLDEWPENGVRFLFSPNYPGLGCARSNRSELVFHSSRTAVTGLASENSKDKRENDEAYGYGSCETFLILNCQFFMIIDNTRQIL